MGYRMSIFCRGYKPFELGKFYGYVALDNLKSIKYLLNKNLIPDGNPDIFNCCWGGPSIKLSAEEFREFMDLYLLDINNYDFSNAGINYKKPYVLTDQWIFFKEVYDSEFDKILAWG